MRTTPSVPPDYLNCAYFAGRAMYYAPEPYKTNWGKVATYCYHKYHGNNNDGFDAMIAVAKDNLTPPCGTVSGRRIAGDTAADLPQCNGRAEARGHRLQPDCDYTGSGFASDFRQGVTFFQNGKQADADKVFDTDQGQVG